LDSEKFTRQVAAILAQRAGNICSNPDCSALTSGPAEEQNRAVNVGEAAHIYGARAGAARFNPEMSDSARGDVTNGIWLCRNCHKQVDTDARMFPAELLFEWRRDHERSMLESLGKAGALRQRVLLRSLQGFESCSYLAQQIIIDRPDFWEYKLTAELLRSSLHPIKLRWEALEKGLYAKPSEIISREAYMDWFKTRMDSMSAQVNALGGLLNGELQGSWGPPGQPGSEHEILRLSGLVSEACQRLLEWEESVRFVSVPEPFEELHELLVGIAGVIIHKAFEIPVWLTGVFSSESPSGVHHFTLVVDLPEEWPDRIAAALKTAEKKLR
jgi:hypothetical protein